MSEKELQFMRRAIELSSIGVRSGGRPFGAVIVKDGEMVGEGHNTVVLSHDPTAHGEVVAIRNACTKLKTWNLSGCELYTSCEPCAMCTSVIWLARIDKVYYANKLADTVKYFDMRPSPHGIIMSTFTHIQPVIALTFSPHIHPSGALLAAALCSNLLIMSGRYSSWSFFTITACQKENT